MREDRANAFVQPRDGDPLLAPPAFRRCHKGINPAPVGKGILQAQSSAAHFIAQAGTLALAGISLPFDPAASDGFQPAPGSLRKGKARP